MMSLTPNNLQELSAALKCLTPESKIIGGGTDLIIAMQAGRVKPDYLLYMGDIEECHRIEKNERYISIGSSVTMTEIAESTLLPDCFAALREAAADVGSLQIRNKATIGGNIANASPAGDLIPVMCLLGARAYIMDSDGNTVVKDVIDVLEGPGKNSLSYNQAIYKFELQITDKVTHFVKLGFRRKVTIARIGLGVGLSLDCDKNILESNVIVSAIAGKPVFFNEINDLIWKKNVADAKVAEIIGNVVGDYIRANTAKEFDRDYKAMAVRGVAMDVMSKFINA